MANLSSLTSFGWKGIKKRVRETEREREGESMEGGGGGGGGEGGGRGLIDKADKPG